MNELVHYLKTTTDSALGIETELGIHVNLCCVSFRSFKYNTPLGTQFWLLSESVCWAAAPFAQVNVHCSLKI